MTQKTLTPVLSQVDHSDVELWTALFLSHGSSGEQVLAQVQLANKGQRSAPVRGCLLPLLLWHLTVSSQTIGDNTNCSIKSPASGLLSALLIVNDMTNSVTYWNLLSRNAAAGLIWCLPQHLYTWTAVYIHRFGETVINVTCSTTVGLTRKPDNRYTSSPTYWTECLSKIECLSKTMIYYNFVCIW